MGRRKSSPNDENVTARKGPRLDRTRLVQGSRAGRAAERAKGPLTGDGDRGKGPATGDEEGARVRF